MLKKITTGIIVLALTLGFGFQTLGADDVLASDSIEVTIHVDVIQKVKVLDPPVAQFEYPWDGAAEGEPLIIEDAGSLRVKSNAGWALKVNSFSATNFHVFVRRQDKERANWKDASAGSYFYGTAGSSRVKFDMKVLPAVTVSSTRSTVRIPLRYTIEQN